VQFQTTERRSSAILPPKALGALLAALAAAVVIAALSYRSLITRSAAADAMQHTQQVTSELNQLQAVVTDGETGQRGFVLTGAERYLTPYTAAHNRLPGLVAVLRQLTLDNGSQQQRITELEPILNAKFAELDETVRLERRHDHAAALEIVNTDRGKDLMDRGRDLITAMLGAERDLLATRTAEWEASVSNSAYIVFGGVAVLIVMIILIGVLASRDYRAVSNEAWVRNVQASLAEQMQGDVRLESLGASVLRTLARKLGAPVGAMYVVEGKQLRRIAQASVKDGTDPIRKFGDGIIGEVAQRDTTVYVDQLPEGYLKITSALGEAKPVALAIAPAVVDGQVVAVTELAFMRPLDALEKSALDRVSESIGIAIRSAKDRGKLEELLGETQRQAEELQAQQEELRVSNEELEQQSRALQLSQSQLENQQAELEQINQQLEEQASSLETQRDELARTSSELQRSSEYKSQFLANMSHELRTPLNSTLILAKLLGDNREKNLNPEQVKFAETIYTAGNDLLTLINDILDLSKIEAGMLDVRPEPVQLRRLVDELTSVFQPVANQKKLQLQLVVEAGVPDTIETDATRVSQILRNLISNALKFTEAGGVTLEIGKARSKNTIEFRVRDTGIGISASQHQLIFEAFRQADGASTRKFGGTGLGLSISRDLARMLGGELVVASEPGKGATFTLTLPQHYSGPIAATPALAGQMPVHQRARSVPGNDHAPVSLEPTTTAPFKDDRARITPQSRSLLIIEDDPAFARVIFDLAHELEFDAIAATTAEDGLALARHYMPSAIVLDVGLPDRSGLAVLDALKRDARTRHIPVHMASVDDFTQTALQMGAAGYVVKPVLREKLVEAIKKLEQKFTQTLRRVLVVEDDPLLRESTARLLSGADVEVITAGTTAAALEQLEAKTFDCMVLDLSLPDRSGVELLEEMSRSDDRAFPPVIVYTGRSLKPDDVQQLEKFSRSIIIKGARSPERLLDEVTLFLHQVESAMPPERQRMLRDARNRESAFEGRKILIAEDDVRNVFALTSILEPKGAKVEIARNGREAIEAVERSPDFDLVLMDIMMPEMDGLEAIRALRAQPAFAKLPIIALTAKAMQDDRDRCIAAGANDYIAKPLDVDKLLSLVRVWIRK
jgi:signal transduction histidine kinase/CheY-like chemotaxis protein/CHASE3 domain sensor protein